MSRSAEDLLGWAYGFMCNAHPMIKWQVENDESYAPEAGEWLDAFNNKFHDEYHAWLKGYFAAKGSEELSLEALLIVLGRIIEGSKSLNYTVGSVHIDTLCDIREHLNRLKDLEK